MDAQAKKKALFRAKLNAQKKDKRIDSPLVRFVLFSLIHLYNSNPTCYSSYKIETLMFKSFMLII